MKIVVLGYMGSGKTAVGKRLAPFLEMPFIDLDKKLVQREERDILSLFKTKGEIYFRKLENQILRELMESPKEAVISLGGGTPCYGDNLELIKKNAAKSIYLKTDLKTLSKRLYSEKANRPLISHYQNLPDLEDFVRKHLFERAYYYQQSDITIDTDGKSVEKITEEILLALN